MKNERPPVYYAEYLQLEKILNAQAPESVKEGVRADDEMLFIIIHQTYELWFKQILHEINIVRDIFAQPNVSDNAPDVYNAVSRLKRVCEILEVLVKQISVLETMTALDFLDFRDFLRPASGFQSIQFKIIEALLGLQYQSRHGQEYYLSQLSETDRLRVQAVESETSLLSLLNVWLERMPLAEHHNAWATSHEKDWGFWQQLRHTYAKDLSEGEQNNLAVFDQLFMTQDTYPTERRLSQLASKNALFIMMYRDHPLLQLPYELLNLLLEIDEQLSLWRYRHIHMVGRTIGKRVGTGGSTGAGYLKAAAESHMIFKEISELTSFLMPRHQLPQPPQEVVACMSFASSR
ncbi:tryptophan 2,3-dioxygenase family protein [Vitreoscilla stercoraria]|nr:tryptophan 2,3-dioxygenase family protein [Vitreoscilla stercoraria]